MKLTDGYTLEVFFSPSYVFIEEKIVGAHRYIERGTSCIYIYIQDREVKIRE